MLSDAVLFVYSNLPLESIIVSCWVELYDFDGDADSCGDICAFVDIAKSALTKLTNDPIVLQINIACWVNTFNESSCSMVSIK